MTSRQYPDHPPDQNIRLTPITRDNLLDHVEPGFADTVPDLLARWRALAPDIRGHFPLTFTSGKALPIGPYTVEDETADSILARVKAGCLVSISWEVDFGSLDAVDYENDPTEKNLEWPWQLNRLNHFWDILAWGSENGDEEARAGLLRTVSQWLKIPIPLQANGFMSRAHRTIDTGIRLGGAYAKTLPALLEHADDDLLCELL